MQFWTCGAGEFNYWFDGVTTTHVEPERWYHVAVTVAGEDIIVYTDGEITFDTRTADFNFTSDIYQVAYTMRETSNRRFYLGLNEFQDWPFKGTIDEFYAFNRALSQNEIKLLMNYEPVSEAAVEPADSPAPSADAPAAAPVTAPQTGDFTIIIFGILAGCSAFNSIDTEKHHMFFCGEQFIFVPRISLNEIWGEKNEEASCVISAGFRKLILHQYGDLDGEMVKNR
jgi:hypothetical protein